MIDAVSLVGAALLLGALPSDEAEPPPASPFKEPETCAACHPRHYQEWRGSAHAYSAIDPIVQAMSRRAHEVTEGKIGDFCVKCHAPLGVRAGELSNGADLKKASALALKGVSCDICHKAEPPPEGKPIADASFELAKGNVFHGRLQSPVATPAHETATSEFIGKSELCGSCHDVLHGSALIERSFEQWSGSIHRERSDQCQTCHMLRYAGQAAVGGPFRETLHRHNFPAVSIPLVQFPNRGYQAEEVKRFLHTAARMTVLAPSVAPAGGDLVLTVRVKNSGAGHNLPTGLANERQMWIEVSVQDESGKVLFVSGDLDANGDLMDGHSALAPKKDAQLLSFSDRFLNEKGEEVPFVFLASKVDEQSLKPLEERGKAYRIPLPAGLEGKSVRARVRLLFRPFPPYALRDLGLTELVPAVPIWEMETYQSDAVPVRKELPRKSELRVPGDYSTIQAAIDALQDGDRIRVARGEYALSRPLDFRGKALEVSSEAGAARTTLRWTGAPEERDACVVLFRSGEGLASKLEGFTLVGGRGVLVDGIRRGGGIYSSRASPSLADIKVASCKATGGIGGGLCFEGGEPDLESITVIDCQAELGGALAVLEPPGKLLRVRGGSLQANKARLGGAIYLAPGTWTRLERLEAAGNHASEAGGFLYSAPGAAWEMEHGTIVFNRASSGPGAIFSAGDEPHRITSSIFWSNVPAGPIVGVSWSIVDWEPAGTNRNAYPLFMDPTGTWTNAGSRWVHGDYRLLLGSPGIDAGDPESAPDPDDTLTDMGAHFFDQPLKAFIRGDVDGDGRVESGDVAALAKLLFLEQPVPCLDAADVDDNGRVEPADAAWLAASLLTGERDIAPPAGSCGLDPTPRDGVTCSKKGKACLGQEL